MSFEFRNPFVLILRDGWGENHNADHDAFNAIRIAKTPCSDTLSAHYPRTELRASGLDVGLPKGIMGNSEVGHQNIGAGRIVDQEIVRIDKSFSSGTLAKNDALKMLFDNVKNKNSALHFMGLASDAGVHSTLSHLYGLISLAKNAEIERIFIHAFTDGRDTPPRSAAQFIAELESQCAKIGAGKIASIAGRFWAMDRDCRWDRIEKAYNCLTDQTAVHKAKSAIEALENHYDHPISKSQSSDEFVLPTQIVGETGKPMGSICNGDSVLFFNFRGDRPRELSRAFVKDSFDEFDRKKKLDIHFATLTEYEKGLCQNVLFPKASPMKNILGGFLSAHGLRQFRCAETEKYPHVTFFFNDYREAPFEGEDWEMVPSPKDVATYDQKPEMSAAGVCEKTRNAILSGKYDFILINFANPDMVGHTGNLQAAKAACEQVDFYLGELIEAIDRVKGRAMIVADHGNAEQMWNPDAKAPHTQHTLNPVEAILYGADCQDISLRTSGRLADIAPTFLEMMGLPQPSEMTGQSLIQH